MRSGLKILFVITLGFLSASCAGKKAITVPNIYFYGDKGKFGATRVESLNPQKPGYRMPKSEWDEKRIGMVCTEAKNVTNLQLIVDMACASNSFACNYAKEAVVEVQKALSSAKRATVE